MAVLFFFGGIPSCIQGFRFNDTDAVCWLIDGHFSWWRSIGLDRRFILDNPSRTICFVCVCLSVVLFTARYEYIARFHLGCCSRWATTIKTVY